MKARITERFSLPRAELKSSSQVSHVAISYCHSGWLSLPSTAQISGTIPSPDAG